MCETRNGKKNFKSPRRSIIVKSIEEKAGQTTTNRKTSKTSYDSIVKCVARKTCRSCIFENGPFEEKCREFNIPEQQKKAIKEILTAANTTKKGRRYSEDWLMQCMLRNIRSPSYYQFLRNHNIISLPCTRTIRQYYSIIDTKCGFDENFAKLISKYLSAKNSM